MRCSLFPTIAVVLILLTRLANGDPIHTAVQQDNVKQILEILKDNPKAVNASNDQQQNRTPLITAINYGKTNAFDELLKHEPDVNLQDQYGYTALHWAAMNRRADFVKPLMAAGANIAIKDKQNRTPLDYAIQYRAYGGSDVTGLLLTGVKDPNEKLPTGELPLHLAARFGYADAVKTLLERKADPAATDAAKRTPLEVAMINNQTAVANVLIPVVDVSNFKTTDGRSLLHWAASNGLTEAVDSLIQRKANINGKNEDGETPLHAAAWNGHYKACGLLLDAGADAQAEDVSSKTPLYGAAWNGHFQTVTTLVKGGAKLADEGYTPLHAAAWQGHHEVVKALLDYGANPDVQDSDGATPLHKASWRGHEKVVAVLLKAKADPNVKDVDGFTAADMAKSAGQNGVLAMLK